MDDQNKAEVARLARKGWTAEQIAAQLHKESTDGLTFNQPSVEAVEAELEQLKGTVTVFYHQMLERTIPVEITREELETLRDSEAGAMDIQQRIVDTAIGKQDEYPLEWTGSTGYWEPEGENGLGYEELFDL